MIRRMTFIFALLVLVLPSQLLEAGSNSSPLGHPAYRGESILTGTVSAHSRDTTWEPESGIVMEVGGMDFLADGRLAISTRMGEVWLLSNVLAEDLSKVEYHRFASGLHEPLGLLVEGDSLLVAQRAELTRLNDRDGDSIADEYLCEAQGWNVSGAYHGYAYGPERDGQGRLWVTLNLDMGDRTNNDGLWRGWGLVVNSQGELKPMAAGMRSPSGLGVNREGDMFYTDQQGNWIPATPIHHLQQGAFYGNPDGLKSQFHRESPLRLSAAVPNRIPFPNAVEALPELAAPAVWLPYDKMGRSATDILLCEAADSFGPFDGQLLVGEFTNSSINRVFLEKVQGVYQGACFPFLSGFPAAVFRLAMADDGSLFVGMTNRGWSSLGTASYGLWRVRYDGQQPPFELKAIRANFGGFELEFTQPVDVTTITAPDALNVSSYTYLYSNAYGSDEIQTKVHSCRVATVSPDKTKVSLSIDNLRTHYVYQFDLNNVLSRSGEPLVHHHGYYTLNKIPPEK